jgi:hypothetical protein
MDEKKVYEGTISTFLDEYHYLVDDSGGYVEVAERDIVLDSIFNEFNGKKVRITVERID